MVVGNCKKKEKKNALDNAEWEWPSSSEGVESFFFPFRLLCGFFLFSLHFDLYV